MATPVQAASSNLREKLADLLDRYQYALTYHRVCELNGRVTEPDPLFTANMKAVKDAYKHDLMSGGGSEWSAAKFVERTCNQLYWRYQRVLEEPGNCYSEEGDTARGYLEEYSTTPTESVQQALDGF